MRHFQWRVALGSILGSLVVGALVVAGWSMQLEAQKKPMTPDGKATKVAIDVKDTDISRVLDAFSQQTGLSVVVGKEVTGAVSVRLFDVQWDQALDAILKPYGFGYERTGDVIVVLPLAKLRETSEIQPLVSRVFKLKYVDAYDIKQVADAQLSPRGKCQVLEMTGQKGWEFGAFGASGSGAQASRSAVGGTSRPQRSYKGSEERRSKSKQLVVTDISTVLDQVAQVIEAVDTMPQQILIESKFMEVDRDRLKDLGVDVSTGSTGTSDDTVNFVAADKATDGSSIFSIGGQALGRWQRPQLSGPSLPRSMPSTRLTPA